jgi:hypothetical protein
MRTPTFASEGKAEARKRHASSSKNVRNVADPRNQLYLLCYFSNIGC